MNGIKIRIKKVLLDKAVADTVAAKMKLMDEQLQELSKPAPAEKTLMEKASAFILMEES